MARGSARQRMACELVEAVQGDTHRRLLISLHMLRLRFTAFRCAQHDGGGREGARGWLGAGGGMSGGVVDGGGADGGGLRCSGRYGTILSYVMEAGVE
ncbi:MAG: hypothetical protein EA364_01405 [Balneolaceae bacterium]|nr:MAG: hypothetical protein EA364_01405 [Balneolaceae bacterium]